MDNARATSRPKRHLSLKLFVWVFWSCNYVSLRKQGTLCIAPKLRGAHFKISILLPGALQSQPLPRRILEPSKCTPQNFGALKVRPAEFWSNAMFAPLSHGDIVMGAKICTKNHLKLSFQRSIHPLGLVFKGKYFVSR